VLGIYLFSHAYYDIAGSPWFPPPPQCYQALFPVRRWDPGNEASIL